MNVDFHQIQRSPQLGLLAAIDHALALAADTLVIAHPELVDDTISDQFPEDLVACQLTEAIANLRRVLVRYHAVIDETRTGIDDDIPF